jgi:hypothetical protein
MQKSPTQSDTILTKQKQRLSKMEALNVKNTSNTMSPKTDDCQSRVVRHCDGRWESLNPEILALIFTRLTAEERIGVLSCVCQSWALCLHGPYCWAEIDIEQWCRKMDRTIFQVDSAVRKLVRRSKGTVRRLTAFKVGDAGFAYVSNWYASSVYFLIRFLVFQVIACKARKKIEWD